MNIVLRFDDRGRRQKEYEKSSVRASNFTITIRRGQCIAVQLRPEMLEGLMPAIILNPKEKNLRVMRVLVPQNT